MNGRTFILGGAVFLVVFAGALWYFQTRFWYEESAGVTELPVAGRTVPVTGWRGIDGASPLKLRACFRLDPAALAGAPPAAGATPLSAPGWFDCFDAATLTADLAAGRATAWLAASDDPKDFETILAVYPDGRGYLWRQLRKEYRE